jgi:hypothetical protein
VTGSYRQLDTLEPLIEAIQAGVVSVGWELSGLQKTTSHHFEGRWAGDSTRSAYLFFHRPEGPEWAGLDVYLDETSRGLSGDLALVVDARPLGELGDARTRLADLTRLGAAFLPEGYKRPVTLRFRLERLEDAPEAASSEIRFKLRIPDVAIAAGGRTLEALASATASAFTRVLSDPGLLPFLE